MSYISSPPRRNPASTPFSLSILLIVSIGVLLFSNVQFSLFQNNQGNSNGRFLSVEALTTNCRLGFYPTEFYLHGLKELYNASAISLPIYKNEQKRILADFVDICQKDIDFASAGLKKATFSWDKKPMRKNLNSANFWLEAVLSKHSSARALLDDPSKPKPKLSNKMKRRMQKFIKMDPIEVLQHELNIHAVDVQNAWMTGDFDSSSIEPISQLLFRWANIPHITITIIALLLLSRFVSMPKLLTKRQQQREINEATTEEERKAVTKFHTFNVKDTLIYLSCLVVMFLAYTRYFGHKYSPFVALSTIVFWFSMLKVHPPYENYKLLYSLNVILAAILTVKLHSSSCAYASVIMLYLFPTLRRPTSRDTKGPGGKQSAQLFTQRQVICLVALVVGIFLKVEEEHELELGSLEPFFVTMEWFSEALINVGAWGWHLAMIRPGEHRPFSSDVLNSLIVVAQLVVLTFFNETSEWTYRATLISAVCAVAYSIFHRMGKKVLLLVPLVAVSVAAAYVIAVSGGDYRQILSMYRSFFGEQKVAASS